MHSCRTGVWEADKKIKCVYIYWQPHKCTRTNRQMDWQCREIDRQTFIQFGQHMHDGLGNAHLLNAHIWRVEQEFWYRKPFIVHPNQLHKKNNDTWATSELSISSSPSSNHYPVTGGLSSAVSLDKTTFAKPLHSSSVSFGFALPDNDDGSVSNPQIIACVQFHSKWSMCLRKLKCTPPNL